MCVAGNAIGENKKFTNNIIYNLNDIIVIVIVVLVGYFLVSSTSSSSEQSSSCVCVTDDGTWVLNVFVPCSI